VHASTEQKHLINPYTQALNLQHKFHKNLYNASTEQRGEGVEYLEVSGRQNKVSGEEDERVAGENPNERRRTAGLDADAAVDCSGRSRGRRGPPERNLLPGGTRRWK
jgi:hypothetical protein